MKRTALLVALVVASVAVPQPAVAQEVPDRCDRTEIRSPGSYSGSLTPSDTDALAFDVPNGEGITVTLSFTGSSSDSELRVFSLNRSVVQKGHEDREPNEYIGVFNDWANSARNDSMTISDPAHFHSQDATIRGLDRELDSSEDHEELGEMGSSADYPVLPYDTGEMFAVDNYNDFSANPSAEFYSDLHRAETGDNRFHVYSNTDEPTCLQLQTVGEQPGEWSLTIERGTDSLATEATTAATTQAATGSSDTATSATTAGSDSTAQSNQATESGPSDPTTSGLQDSDGDGVVDSEDYAPRDPDVQEKSDLEDDSAVPVPGFGAPATLLAVALAALVALRGRN
ncbi:hypothetical protein [Halorussus halobius]|uniref:hypothetical protein n=1 Tax=Halorussus halobius TaxID=1710537 RepID=UPI001B2FFCF1|nr:hypothetical protein [Halorussus halobius]